MNKRVIRIVSTLIFCFWTPGDVAAEETNGKALPPIQFAKGDKNFAALNQERVDIVRQIPGLVALWDFVQRRDSWQDFIGTGTLAHPGNPVSYTHLTLPTILLV